MGRVRTVIIRCRWDFFPTGWPDPPTIPDQTLRTMFSDAQGKWGIAELWKNATLGEIEFDPPVIIEIGALTGLGFNGSLNPDGSLKKAGRVETVDAALKKAKEEKDYTQAENDIVVVLIGPPPSDAGYVPGTQRCLLDVNGNHSFMSHEVGHALGFDHSWGEAFGNPDAEYCDPYCLMSCNIFGYRAPWANGLPPGMAISGLPPGWDIQMGPLPAAAMVWRYNFDFAKCPAVVKLDASAHPPTITLVSYGNAWTQSNMVLAVVATAANTWLIEYRGAHGFDRGIGLGPKFNPGAKGNYDSTPQGIVIHRLDSVRNVVFAGVISTQRPSSRFKPTWNAPDDRFRVELLAVAPDRATATIRVVAPRLMAMRLGGETSPYGAACVSLGNVFVNEDHYVAWTGAGNRYLNIAKSDDTQHQISRPDSANGNLAAARDGSLIWIAWTGTNPGRTLNLFSGDRNNVFNRKIVRPSDSSRVGPALAVLHNRLYLAYQGNDDRLYVVAGADNPSAAAYGVGAETASSGPGLTAYAGRLYLAWAGTDGLGLLNVMSSSDGVNWDNKWTFPHETSGFAPAVIGADSGLLYLAWVGTNSARSLNLGAVELSSLVRANPDGQFIGKLTYPSGSIGPPALAPTINGYDLIMAWAGTDASLYTAYLEDPFREPQ